MPADFRRLGATVAAMTLFASNFLLVRHSGYFDTGAEVNPLLHTWSLAVEEQYYLVFPLVVAAMLLISARAFLIALVTLCILSFGWSVLHLMHDPSGAFYLPVGRTWELLLGAMICVRRQVVGPAAGSLSFSRRRRRGPDHLERLGVFRQYAVSRRLRACSLPGRGLHHLLRRPASDHGRAHARRARSRIHRSHFLIPSTFGTGR